MGVQGQSKHFLRVSPGVDSGGVDPNQGVVVLVVEVGEGVDHLGGDGVVDKGGGLTFPAEGHGSEVQVGEAG